MPPPNVDCGIGFELRRTALGNMHQETVWLMNQLALLHWRQGRQNEAEPLSREAYVVGLQLLWTEPP